MRKFKFSEATPANPAKVPDSQGTSSAKPLLTIAKVDQKKQNISNFSKSLARHEPFKINNLSNISNISSHQGINLKKTYQQQYDALWKKAWALADWIDDSKSDVPWQERAARVPELQQMSMMIGELELLIDQKKRRKNE